jgi:phospholipase/carboxylesterase
MTTTTNVELSHLHRFVDGDRERPLLLLHGTGGDEEDLVPLGERLAPGAALLSPRGKVSENGANRFFRRLAEGVFDLDDLRARTKELAGFVTEARRAYGLGAPLALGYSNGANIAASLLLAQPDVLRGAILLRAMVPFEPSVVPDLSGKPVLILSGAMDPIVPTANAERLAALLTQAGAAVTHRVLPMGHGLGQGDLVEAARWLQQVA